MTALRRPVPRPRTPTDSSRAAPHFRQRIRRWPAAGVFATPTAAKLWHSAPTHGAIDKNAAAALAKDREYCSASGVSTQTPARGEIHEVVLQPWSLLVGPAYRSARSRATVRPRQGRHAQQEDRKRRRFFGDQPQGLRASAGAG